SGMALSLNRATPITRVFLPAASAERRISCASVGPILPPTPRRSTSPSISRIAAISASEGRDIRSSNCSTVVIFMSPQLESCNGVHHRIVVLHHFPAAHTPQGSAERETELLCAPY